MDNQPLLADVKALSEMHEQGVLTNAEFAAAKGRLLGIAPAPTEAYAVEEGRAAKQAAAPRTAPPQMSCPTWSGLKMKTKRSIVMLLFACNYALICYAGYTVIRQRDSVGEYDTDWDKWLGVAILTGGGWGLFVFVFGLLLHAVVFKRADDSVFHGNMSTATFRVNGQITLAADDFDCSKLTIAASMLLTSGVDGAAASSESSSTSRFELSTGAARGVMLSCSPEVAETVLSFFAGAVRNLHDRFARYKEVDEATLRHFVEHGMSAAPESSEKEKAFVLRRLRDDNQDDSSWSRLSGTVRESVSYFKKVDGDSNTWGKGKGNIDASAPDVLAWLWHSCTYERNHTERKNSNLLQMELGVSGTRSKFMVFSTKMPGAISNRIFATWWTWAKEQNGDLIAAFTPHDEYGPGAEKHIIDTALKAVKSSVLGTLRGFYRIKTLASNVCRVTLLVQGDAGGTIGKQAMAWGIKFTLSMVKKLQDKYMRNGAKVDAEMRGAFPAPPLRRSLTSEQVDYGANLKVVRGKTTGVLRFKPINDDTQCEVTLVQHLDAGGFVPEWVVVASIPRALSGVDSMQELFQRDDAIDGAKRSELAAIINTSEQPYLPDEDELIADVGAKFASLPAFEKLDSPDHFVHMSSVFKEENSNAIGRATTIVDASIAEVAAWELAKMSRENLKEHVAFGGLDRNLVRINDHQNIYHVVYDVSIPGFLPRQWVSRLVWKWEEDKKELTVALDTIEHGAFPKRKEYLRASTTTLVKYKQEANVGEIPQTKVTWTQQVDLGGAIPKWVNNRQGVSTLMYLSLMRERFDRSLELHGKKREELVKMIKRHGRDGVEYSEEEERIVAEGKTWFKAFNGLKSKDVDMRSPQTKGRVAYKRGDSRAWGWSIATVRASPEEVLARVWDVKSRDKMEPDDLEKEIDEQPNDHNQLVFIKKQSPAAVISNRDFLSRMVWEKSESGGIMNRYIGSNLAYVTEIQEYFLQLKGKYDKADGRALGYRLTYPDEKNKKKPSEAVARIVKLHKGLSQLSREYPWIVAFLEEVLKGGLHRNKAVSTKLDCLSEAEARKIGKNLPQALRARKTADAGVYQWEKQNPSMVELFEKYPWVEEMVLTMGEELLKNAAWGLWFRVITGSGLSMVDLATDINMILVYFAEEGQEGYGWMMLGMVLASMGLQLVLVLVQNGKAGWGKLLREVLITVSGLKPGVDAMRVVAKAEMDEHHMLSAKMELAATKCVEMFCESIPGCILQVTALIQGGSGGKMGTKVFSIVVSAITTGMNSASISYDFDSDPKQRRLLPSFYGYLPDEGNARTIMG
ncbi:hypothetical protein TeGR_g7990 [Tetraparma gracilis]|uniref:START domain-containing protein n=1 Tax=Tetraparma gracilis TaxID=2962635 RepID=A0ABQ6MWH2_9STRA|nr:hypothetical protein TeGR_g7990 [Tetraparma gracilis]